MMNVGEICNRTVVFADRRMTLSEAARLMREEHVGSLVVIDETERGRVPVGMLTDRDIVVAVVAKEVDAHTLSVGEVMSENPAIAHEADGMFDALHLMRSRGVRRVPVTSASGMLVGILTIDDVLEVLADNLREMVQAIGSEHRHEVRSRT
jgi:CBS domain-containing protein